MSPINSYTDQDMDHYCRTSHHLSYQSLSPNIPPLQVATGSISITTGQSGFCVFHTTLVLVDLTSCLFRLSF